MNDRFAPQLKLAKSPKLIDYLLGKVIMPIHVEISLVGFCNAGCSFCFYNNKVTDTLKGWDKNSLKTEALNVLFRDFALLGIKAISYKGGGDSSLHKDIKEIVQMAYNYELKQGFITNGLIVKYDPKLLEWVRVSLTDKPWPIENLKKLRECKVLGMNVNYQGDEDEVKRSLDIAYQVNADYLEVRPAFKLNGKTTSIEEPKLEDPKLKKIGYKFEDVKIPHGTYYTKCQGYHFTPFLWQDGDVDVCAYHKDKKEYNLGNIYRDSFAQIMTRAPKSVEVIPTCQVCCREHEANKLINSMQTLKDEDFV